MSDPGEVQPTDNSSAPPVDLDRVAAVEEGGDAACWAEQVCDTCGALAGPGHVHDGAAG